MVKRLCLVALGLGLTLVATPVLAASITHGDFVGTRVLYLGVAEESVTDAVPLFGSPTLVGDSLDFDPLFTATASGVASDATIATLSFVLAAQLGTRIGELGIAESGETTLSGNDSPGSMDTQTRVLATGTLVIQEVDFAAITPVIVPFSLTFSPSGGTYFLGTDGGGGPIYNTDFSGLSTLPIELILTAENVPFTFGATRLSLELTDDLLAESKLGTSATISKTDLHITPTLRTVRGEAPVPEPSTILLMGLGAVGVALRRQALQRR